MGRVGEERDAEERAIFAKGESVVNTEIPREESEEREARAVVYAGNNLYCAGNLYQRKIKNICELLARTKGEFYRALRHSVKLAASPPVPMRLHNTTSYGLSTSLILLIDAVSITSIPSPAW